MITRQLTGRRRSVLRRCAVAASAVADAWMGRATPGQRWFRDQLADAWRRPEPDPSSTDDSWRHTTPPGIDDLTVLAPGTSPLVDAIAAAKYGADGDPWRWLGRRLGLELRASAAWLERSERSADVAPPIARPIVVPMPSPMLRRRHRGIDHTGLLAIEVAAAIGGSVRPWLARGWGPPQVGADRRVRASVSARMSPAWRWTVDRWIAGRRRPDPRRHIVVVDDVLTTGASLSAAAGVLRRLGWWHVHAAVLVAHRPSDTAAIDGLSTDCPRSWGESWA